MYLLKQSIKKNQENSRNIQESRKEFKKIQAVCVTSAISFNWEKVIKVFGL